MKIIPYEKYFLITQLTREEAIERLKENIQVGSFFKRRFTGDKAYEGEIVKDNFEMKMITPGQNPFKAVINGRILNEQNTTLIEIKLRMQDVGIVFSMVIAIMLILSIYFVIKDLINHAHKTDSEVGAVVLFIVSIVFLGFYHLHTQYIKENLKTMFEAEELK